MNLSQRLKAERIVQIVCNELHVTESELKAKCKKARSVKSRRTAIIIMSANGISYRQAASIMGMGVASVHACCKTATLHQKRSKKYRSELYNIITRFHNENNNTNSIAMNNISEINEPDILGIGQSERFEIIGEPIAFMAHKGYFHVCVNNFETQRLSYHDISFEEFGLKYADCDNKEKAITCYQWDKDGHEHEIQLSLWDFIHEHFYSVDEPHFTEDIKKENRKLIEETLLNIIEGRY